MQKLSANGLQFMTTQQGNGPKLLFLNGTGSDLRKPHSPLLLPLVNEFTVFSYDQRGMGQSDKPDQPYTMQDYAEDARALLDVIGWEQVLVIGFSFGGMVAQELAIRWPERVRRLVLVSTTAGGIGGASYPLHELAGLEPAVRARRVMELLDRDFSPAWQAKHPVQTQQRVSDFMATQDQFADEPGAATGAARQLAARAEHDTYERLVAITAPTLVLAGERDGQAPLLAQELMAQKIPQAQFALMDGPHSLLWENTAAMERVTDFLLDE